MESFIGQLRPFEVVAFFLTVATVYLGLAGYLWIETRLLILLLRRELATCTPQSFQKPDPKLIFCSHQPYPYTLRALIWARQIFFGLAIFLAIQMQLDWFAWRIFTVLLEAIWQVYIA
jgi:hypothetical protein